MPWIRPSALNAMSCIDPNAAVRPSCHVNGPTRVAVPVMGSNVQSSFGELRYIGAEAVAKARASGASQGSATAEARGTRNSSPEDSSGIVTVAENAPYLEA